MFNGIQKGIRDLKRRLNRRYATFPNSDNFGEKVECINRFVGDIQESHEGNEKTIIYLPDIHSSHIHQRHAKIAMLLKEYLGITLLGVEGYSEIVDKEIVEAKFQNIKTNYAEGKIDQHTRNDAFLFGRKPRAPKDFTLGDFFEKYPLLQIAYNSDMDVVGVEYEDLEDFIWVCHTVQKSFLFDQNLTEGNSLEGKIRAVFYDALQLQREINKSINLPYDLDDIEKRLQTMPRIDKENRIEFLDCITRPLMVNFHYFRGRKAVQLSNDIMDETGINQMILVYGEGHMPEIKEELNAQNNSYVIL